MGLAHKSFGPHNSPSKPGCPTSWLDRGALVMQNLFLRPNQFGLVIMLAALHLPKRCTGLQDSLLILFLMRSCRLVIQNAFLMTSIYETTLIRRFLMRWRSGTGIFVFADSFGDLNLLNASRSTLRIRGMVGGYCFCKESLFILLRFEILGLP